MEYNLVIQLVRIVLPKQLPTMNTNVKIKVNILLDILGEFFGHKRIILILG
jgi:hypothetical protein